jgi:ribosomal protein S12 methylthiotransferase
MERARAISARRLGERIGQELTVLVDSVDVDTGAAIARSAAEAPEIDGVIRLEGAAQIAPGSWAQARITGADDYDLEGRIIRSRVAPSA